MVPACSSVGVGWEVQGYKRHNCLCQHFCLGESSLPALTLMLDNSDPPHMALVPSKLLPWQWSSEAVSPKEACAWALQLGTAEVSVFDSLNICWIYSQMLWRLIFLELEPCAGGAWDPSLLRYPSDFHLPYMCGTSLFHISIPPTSLDVISSLIP